MNRWWSVSPSLAIVKYWGKLDPERNLPATPSLAVGLDGFKTRTRAFLTDGEDLVCLNGELQNPGRFEPFFSYFRKVRGTTRGFRVETENNFPESAGLASSSSGFAAMSLACLDCLEGFPQRDPDRSLASRIALRGSASAARAVFGGFTVLYAGKNEAFQLYPSTWWPEFRIIVVTVDPGKKPLSSRKAMELTRKTSPFYTSWLKDATLLFHEASTALANRNMESLGRAAVASYSRMFATMFGANPPIHYWQPESIALIRSCQELRKRGVGAWETMDAGPQVKVFCIEKDAAVILDEFCSLNLEIEITVTKPSADPIPERE